MTRINCGIPPAELTDKHLMAEHREIKRIPNCIKKGRYSMHGQPDEFTLGTGHVKFFYDKLDYLYKRYEELYNECITRGFNVSSYHAAWDDVPDCLRNDYKPTDRDRQIIRERINERLNK
jgi:deoxyribonuclease (pyrimidine dimer)